MSNFYAAILGDKDAIKGGSGKVVDSGPNDHIFIYYTDHGGPGVLGKHFCGGFVHYTYLKYFVEYIIAALILDSLLKDAVQVW